METKKYKVITNETSLNLRLQANTDSEILASIPKGAIVSQNLVMPVYDGWVAVSYEGKNGYVSSQFIEEYKEGDSKVPDKTGAEGAEKSSSDKLLIAGCIVAAVGAIVNILI